MAQNSDFAGEQSRIVTARAVVMIVPHRGCVRGMVAVQTVGAGRALLPVQHCQRRQATGKSARPTCHHTADAPPHRQAATLVVANESTVV